MLVLTVTTSRFDNTLFLIDVLVFEKSKEKDWEKSLTTSY